MKRARRDGTGTIDAKRCLRLTRPLLSKIHNLNDLKVKSPTIFEINYGEVGERVDQNKQTISLSLDLVDIKMKRKRCEDLGEKFHENGEASDDDWDYESTQDDIDDDIAGNLRKGNKSSYQDVPASSWERLQNLKPVLSNELFEAYVESFEIVKAAVTSIMSGDLGNSKLPKLSSLCSIKIGKKIALSTKTTYYKLSRTLLFDSKTIPFDLKQYQQELDDDITSWFTDNHDRDNDFVYHQRRILGAHRKELLLGYLVHLLAIHLTLIYYLFVPVIVHWLEEEYNRTCLTLFRTLKTCLFNEYWTQSINESTEEEKIFKILNGEFDNSMNTHMFWKLHKSNYWKALIETQSIQSNYRHGDVYNNYFLDSLVSRIKNDSEIFNGSRISEKNISYIYDALVQTPTHCRINEVLMALIGQLLNQTREMTLKSDCLKTFVNNLVLSYNRLTRFLSVWIGFRKDGGAIFTSLYSGNFSIFQAIIAVCKFLISKVFDVINRIKSVNQEYLLDSKFIQLKTISSNLKQLVIITTILGYYYCNINEVNINEVVNLKENDIFGISKNLIQNLTGVRYSCNCGLNKFLKWLHYLNHQKFKYLAQVCFITYYGIKSKIRLSDVISLKQLLFI